MARRPTPQRGEVWIVSLDETIGHEVQKTRLAGIVTNHIYNQNNWVVTIVPLITRERPEYAQVLVQPPKNGLTNASVTLPGQIRAVDRTRLVLSLEKLNLDTLERLDRSLKTVLGLRQER